MPEEKKKDSFTFSDKIKNSKPVPSKSFANRISSKIGSDGKPKKTLFERTRRDAPFFIAALVALLLLPFLYKYSGQVSEEPVVLPGSEESIFDPERYGFDTATGDPDGQIEQLAGRDPLSLIKGFGSQDENTTDARYDQPVDRSGLSDDDSYNSSTVEENNTNIYKRQAAPATRAAFRRAATKINKLDGAGMTGRSGGKLGVGMWGGNLKSAAKKVGSSAPRTSPKPVSLQPLQAAGKPSRSYFGQGAAAEARRSKDAMSKANAMQALRDAAMKPVEPGKIGGLGGGAFGPGGGNGKLDRHFAWNGKEPWWWDMMKKRSQMEWEAKFNRKWDWIKWGDKLAQNILGGILNCLLTGADDGGMGSMFGQGAGDGAEATCCGKKASKIAAAIKQQTGLPFGKEGCDNYVSVVGKERCSEGWKDSKKADTNLGFIGVRVKCLGMIGGGSSKYAQGTPGMQDEGGNGVDGDCQTFAQTYVYRTMPQGKAMKWKKYHYVTARNYVPVKMGTVDKGYYLCGDNSSKLDFTGRHSAGVSRLVGAGTAAQRQQLDKFLTQWDEKDKTGSYVNRAGLLQAFKKYLPESEQGKLSESSSKETVQRVLLPYVNSRESYVSNKNEYDTFVPYDREEEMNSCVVYVGESEVFEYQKFKSSMQQTLKKWASKNGVSLDPEEAFNNMDFFFIETMFSEDSLYSGSGKRGASEILPMKWEDFQTAYLFRKGVSNNVQKKKEDVYKKEYRILNPSDGTVDTIIGHRCYFPSTRISCKDNTSPAMATVTFSAGVKGGNAATKNDIRVKAAFKPAEKTDETVFAEGVDVTKNVVDSVTTNRTVTYFYTPTANDGKNAATRQADDRQGYVLWTVLRGGKAVSRATCEYNNSDAPVPDPEGVCTNGTTETRTNSDGCEEKRTCTNGVWGSFEKVDPNCVCKGGTIKGLEDSPAGCHWAQACQNNAWTDPYQTNPNDPACNQGGSAPQPLEKVRFYTRLDKLPKQVWNDKGRKDQTERDNGSISRWQGACKINDIGKKQIAYAQDVKAYMEEAVAKYNAHEGSTSVMESYGEQFAGSAAPTIASVVDAMRIMQEAGVTDVPLNTVCAMAKTIGWASTDPYVKRARPNQKYGRDNIFGTFAAYIDEDSSFFPGAKVIQAGETSSRNDVRFLGCRQQSSSGVGQAYHYGHYNWNEHKIGDQAGGGRISQNDREPYVAILNAGPWKGFPLKAIGEAVAFKREISNYDRTRSTNGTLDDQNRRAYHEAYYNVFKSAGSCELNGTMNVSDALKYIESLCQNGSAIKPQNGSKIPCGAKYRASTYNVTQKN